MDKFRFSGAVSLQKGVDEVDGKPFKMVVSGVASTADQDFDGEFMNPNGFDVSYFQKFGFINWAHQSNKDPLAIIGRPTLVKIDSKLNEMFVEATLFNSSEKARQVYRLGEILEEEGYSLAFSIEGKVTERDKNDPRKVLSAKITGCAITPTPKNNGSSAKIQKGIGDEDLYSIIKGMDNTEVFELVKGLMEDSEEDEDELKKDKKKRKAMDTAAIAPATKESLDKKLIVTTEKLSKGQVMTILREDLPNTSEDMLEEVFDFILTIEKSVSMNKPEISPEALASAYAKLDIVKGTDSADDLGASTTEGGETTEAEPEVEEAPETVAEPEVEEESETPETEAPSQDVIDAAQEILKSVGFEVTPKAEAPKTDAPKAEAPKTTIEKGLGGEGATGLEAILKEELGILSKGIGEKFGAVSTIFSSLDSKISAVQAENAELRKAVDGFGNASQGKKSVTTAAYIEKGAGTGEQLGGQSAGDGKQILSISNPMHKDVILQKGDDACGISTGTVTNFDLANEVALFESSGKVIPNGHLVKAMASANITLVQ